MCPNTTHLPPLSGRAESCCLLQCSLSLALAWDETPSMNNLPFSFSFTCNEPSSTLFGLSRARVPYRMIWREQCLTGWMKKEGWERTHNNFIVQTESNYILCMLYSQYINSEAYKVVDSSWSTLLKDASITNFGVDHQSRSWYLRYLPISWQACRLVSWYWLGSS